MPPLPMTFVRGQCWISEGEPELGIGFVSEQDSSVVAIEFPSASQARLYGKRSAPLRRLEFRIGETVLTKKGEKLTVEKIETRDGLFWYCEGATEFCENQLSATLKLQRPLERFLAGQWDSVKAFDLRRRTLDLWHRSLRSPVRGMLGARAQLLPHQLYVSDQIASRGLPRALLADEVGLGKTIEAGWILHRLSVNGRVRRALVITPESLVNQWFIELFKRFNLSFWVPESQSEDGIEKEDLETQERVILSLESLKKLDEKGAIADTQWDLIIVDEAHRVQPGSAEYQILEKLSAKTRGLLLLTATPEQLGIEGHFARLKLIDPSRFTTLEKYESEHRKYQEVVKKADAILKEGELNDARRKKLKDLVDSHGTGRVYFRNARSVVELEHCSFPKRTLARHVLKGEASKKAKSEALVQWLAQFGKEHRKEKTLLICSSANQVIEWEKRLREEFGLKVVAFHEKLPLLARDRNAAYFEDPEGATLLLSSELGGEGRNFQHASHLILADLPADPDALEQRIGRLDRIGQASDITLHVPHFEESREELLLEWHDKVFGAFEKPTQGARAVYEQYKDALETALDKGSIKTLLPKAKKSYQETVAKIEAGRDRLIEINSFDPEAGTALAKSIGEAETTAELREFLETILDTLGIHSEDLDADSLFIEPGDSMFVSYFPALPPEGLRATFSRKKALARDDLSLMTWDHPMITETLESVGTQEMGNMAVAAWKESQLLLEATYIFEPGPVGSEWGAHEFFPPKAIRVVLDPQSVDLTSQWERSKLQAALVPLSEVTATLAKKLPGERLRAILRKGLGHAEKAGAPAKTAALEKLSSTLQAEITRLKQLREKNGLVSESELKWWDERKTKLEKSFQDAKVRLDSFMLILPQA